MKDFKKSCQTLGVAQQGNSAVVVLAVVAVAAAGVLGFVAGKNNGPGSMSNIQPPIAAAIQAEDTADSGQPNPVVASVDGIDIKRQEIIDLVNAMPPQMRQIPSDQLFPMALEQAIGNILADSKAGSSSLENDPAVQKQIWQARQQIIRANFVERAVASRITEDMLKAEYDTYVEKFPVIEEVKAAHILVEDEKTANDIIGKLDSGADFAELAKENSKDGSAERGGELGYFAKNEVVPEFAEAAFSAKVGSYVNKPVKSEFGYHIVRVDEKRMRPPASFDSVKPFVRQELERVELQTMLNEWKSAANIERFDINGNPVKADDANGGLAAAEPEAGSVEAAEPAAE
jgi:peptidyl-prolyl cis-trans isomerase C